MSTSENTKSKTISDIIKNWFLNSPSIGIKRIGQAKTLIARLFWGYSFWVFTIFMGCFINIVVLYYIGHPTKIHFAVRQHRDPKHFPAITFCNIIPLQDDGFINDEKKGSLSGSRGSSPSSEANESEYRQKVTAYMKRILANQVSGERHPLVQWGFQLNDLLITCMFNNKLCYRNLTEVFHPNYGNCYTFDNDVHVRDKEINDIRHDWSIDGDNGDENYRLFLELFLHQKEYNAFLDSRAGFRVFIHRKREIPMLSETSLFLGPNRYTKLSFIPRVMSFSQQCRNDLTLSMKRIFPTYQVRYTQALCYKLCEDQFIIKQCKCIKPTFAVFYQFYNDNLDKANISLCPFEDKCLESRGYFNASALCPNCLPECEIIQYSVQSSYAAYPNANANEKIVQRVRTYFRLNGKNNNYFKNTSSGSPSNRQRSLHNNIVAFEIFASPYPTEVLTESPMYTWVDLISSIGGQTSLWIGISLISLVEILDLLYVLFGRFCSYLFFCKKE